jgi:hypothetical protein
MSDVIKESEFGTLNRSVLAQFTTLKVRENKCKGVPVKRFREFY